MIINIFLFWSLSVAKISFPFKSQVKNFNMVDIKTLPLKEREKEIRYRLRSIFYYEQLHKWGFFGFKDRIEELLKQQDAYKWDNRAKWGIKLSLRN